jgi:hypothetical protein
VKIRNLVVAAVVASCGVIALPGSASAATYSLDGQSPVTAGCSSDATTAVGGEIKADNGNGVIGAIDLRYSVACHAAWARVRISVSADLPGKAEITRTNDGKSYSCTNLTYSSSLGLYSCYTAMVYDKDPLTSYAYGSGTWNGSVWGKITAKY